MINIYILCDFIFTLIEKIDLKNKNIMNPKLLLLINEYFLIIKSVYIERKINQYDMEYEALCHERNKLEENIYKAERYIKDIEIDFINEFSEYLKECPKKIHSLNNLKEIKRCRRVYILFLVI